MNGKFLLYGIIVTMLSTGVSWTKFLAVTAADSTSSSGRGSSWTSTTGGSGGTGSGGHFHAFGSDQGVTGVVLLAESHISIHTWPEFGFVATDIFMCGKADPERALEVIRKALKPTSCTLQTVGRGRAEEWRAFTDIQ
jgi:S-adenosylmethionine decarboxylase proenzyme